jgi:hypothetical protein
LQDLLGAARTGQAKLLPEASDLYPGVPAGVWMQAATLADIVLVLAFEKWVRRLDPESRTRERAYIRLQSDCAKAFWAAVLFIYSAAALLGFGPQCQ